MRHKDSLELDQCQVPNNQEKLRHRLFLGQDSAHSDSVVFSVSHQMLSLSATAMQVLKGWNFTTDGTPGLRLMKIWSSSREIPATEGRNRAKNCKRLWKQRGHVFDSWCGLNDSYSHLEYLICKKTHVWMNNWPNKYFSKVLNMCWSCKCINYSQEITTAVP